MAKSGDRWTKKRGLKTFQKILSAPDEERRFARDLDIVLGSDGDGALQLLTDLYCYNSAWPIARAAVAIDRGDGAGWAAFQTSFRRRVLRILARFGHHDALKIEVAAGRAKKQYVSPIILHDMAAICRALLYAIVTREEGCATLLGDYLIDHLRRPDELFGPDVFGDTPFESFTVLLYCRSRGIREEAVEQLLSNPRRFTLLHSDIYRRVFLSWDEPNAFAEAVRGMVELRSKWTDRDDEPWEEIPYTVVPIEFLALQRVREEQGHEFPIPDHEMLRTPWATPPEGLSNVLNDAMWDKVVTRCRHFLPGLILPPSWEPMR